MYSLPYLCPPGPAIEEQPEYLLLDPTSGKTEMVQGDFKPFNTETYRPLQSSRNVNNTWAAIGDYKSRITVIGLYDIKTFNFKPMMEIPSLLFNSMNMFVDEETSQIYIAVNGVDFSIIGTDKQNIF